MSNLTVQNEQYAVATAAPSNINIVNIAELKQRANSVQLIKKEIMQENVHFGVIPGCGEKPTLFKNGAELLCMAFKLAPSVEVKVAELGSGHREYTVTTILSVIGTGEMVASGIGCCSTMESKYRYRGVEKIYTDKPLPSEYWDLKNTNKAKAQEILGGKGYSAGKNPDGKWVICKNAGKMENPDIADVYNTVLKMAAKRSLIDATLKATGGSCEFTQDLEDIKENNNASTQQPKSTYYEEVYSEPAPVQQPEPQKPKPLSKQKLATFQTWQEDAKKRVGANMYDLVLNRFGGLDNVLNNVAEMKKFIAAVNDLPDYLTDEGSVNEAQEELPF